MSTKEAKPYNPKWKGPVPVPDIEVYARPHGQIQLMCPACGNLNGSFKNQFWRKAQIQCKRDGCKRKFRIGIGITDSEGAYRCLMAGPFKGNVVNKVNPVGSPLMGRVFGALDYECPKCLKAQSTEIPFTSGLIHCINCKYEYFVQLLIYTPGGYPKLICPFDFTVLFTNADKTTYSSNAVSALPQVAGTSNQSTGTDSENSNQ